MKMPHNFSEITELALMLQNSNIKEIEQLAKGYLELEAAYGELRQQLIHQTSELVMRRHESLFKKLAENEAKEKTNERTDDSKS